jgi:hypothetical protein
MKLRGAPVGLDSGSITGVVAGVGAPIIGVGVGDFGTFFNLFGAFFGA